ncbi:MAG: sensor histidine kinase [Methanomicrobiales archaeon]
MRDRPTTHHRGVELRHYVLISLLLLGAVLIATLTTFSYLESREDLVRNAGDMEDMTEAEIVQSLSLVDRGLKLFDETLNYRMQDGFDLFLAEYARSGNDPSRMDLTAVREEIGSNMDLYIIDEHGVIIRSTEESEIGLDFRKYPRFYSYITDIREGDSFVSDRVVRELSTGSLKKFAYMPTPDHRYLLELGLDYEVFGEQRLGLSYTNTVRELVDENPSLSSVRLFDITGGPVGDLPPPEWGRSLGPDSPLRNGHLADALDQVRTTHEPVDIPDIPEGWKTRYIYVNLSDPDYPSDMSLIAEVTYNTTALTDRLDSLWSTHILIAGIAFLLIGGVGFVFERKIYRPLKGIVADIDRIARGDLDHTIRQAPGAETRRLVESITTMVAALKEQIQRTEESEARLREYSRNLQDQVDERTRDLRVANERLTLMNSIIRHDILNQLHILNGYVELAQERMEDEEASRYLSRIARSSSVIRDQIEFTRDYQEMGVHVPGWERVGAMLPENPPIRLIDETDGLRVYADPLVKKVFSNLLDNTLRHGESATMVRVRFHRDEGGGLTLLWEDDGGGIPPEEKERIFERGVGVNTGLGLFMIREVLSITGITIEETGEYGEGARFEMHLPPGAWKVDGDEGGGD